MKGRALVGAAFLVAAGCGGDGQARSELLVFAAASLTESFTATAEAFQRAHRGVLVRFNFGPSDGLATGISSGAPADVFASASERWMDEVESRRGVSHRSVFARNRLVMLVPKDNPAALRTFADVARPGVKLVVAVGSVPAGGYAREALAKAGIASAERNIVSNEEDVKGVVQKVVLGEADAGIAYATDVTSAVRRNVSVIDIPDAVNVVASYPIAVVRGSRNAEAARSFVAFVLGEGGSILRDGGFLPP